MEGLPEKLVLGLESALFYSSKIVLKSDDGKIFVVYLPLNATMLFQPIDQGVITSFNKMYRATVVRKCIEEDDEFLRTFTILKICKYIRIFNGFLGVQRCVQLKMCLSKNSKLPKFTNNIHCCRQINNVLMYNFMIRNSSLGQYMFLNQL